MVRALNAYADLIEPWAQRVAASMVTEAVVRTDRMWRILSKRMGVALRSELAEQPTGVAVKELLDEQVGLITSLPREAAKRVHELAQKSMIEGTRAGVIAQEILRTQEVTVSRARLIARTEASRCASVLTEARSVYAGSEGYIWRTSGDFDVRDSHAEMEGRYVRWDTKPRLSDGTVTHAGQIYNCRCWAEPVLPEDQELL